MASNKTTVYIILMSGIMLLMYYAGFLENNASATLLKLLLSPQDFSVSTLALFMVSSIAAVAGTAISVTLLITGKYDLALLWGVSTYLFDMGVGFLDVLNNIISISNGTFKPLVIILYSPILILWIITIIEFWRGADT